jgi:diguanylate cyclase (GGDEF)-like protein
MSTINVAKPHDIEDPEPVIKLVQAIDINIFSVILSAVILAAASNRRERGMAQNNLFILLVTSNILMNILEICAWIFDAQVGAAGPVFRSLNLAFNTLYYALATIPVMLWLLYANYQLFRQKRTLLIAAAATAPAILADAVLSVLSPGTGWYFNVDNANHYHRGPLFLIHVLFVYGILLAVCLMVLVFRKRLDKRTFRALILFNIPPFVGSVLQVAFYGLLLNWVAVTISILIIYLYIQDRGLNTDYLTGTYNRRHFESIIQNRIRRSEPGQSFALVLADLDGFKKINDLHGHNAGDEALKTAVGLIRRNLRRDDLIARYGGDEFYILMEMSDDGALKRAIQRIYMDFEQYNRASSLPYAIELSMGGEVYNPASGMGADHFLRHVDVLMYMEKTRRYAAREEARQEVPDVQGR